MKKIREMLLNEKGYGTVELLILVAALGVLAVGVTLGITDKLTDDSEGGAVGEINKTITDLLKKAGGED